MNPIQLDDFEVTVTKVSSVGNFGGCVFWGTVSDGLANNITRHKLTVNVAGSYFYFPQGIKVIPGDRWLINGTCTLEHRTTQRGYSHSVLSVKVSKAEMTYCEKYSLPDMLQEVPGLGASKVTKLIEAFGENSLRLHIETDNQIKLEQCLTPEMSERVIHWWKRHGGSDDYRFFMQFGLTAKEAGLLTDFYAPYPKQRLNEDPYAALSLTDNFNAVDQLARAGFGVALEDPRRLYAIVEKSLFDLVAKGHSACTDKMLIETIKKSTYKFNGARLTVQSMRDVITTHGKHQIFIDEKTGLISPIAAYEIEKDICQQITQLLDNNTESGLLKSDDIDQLIGGFNKQEQLRLNSPEFSLNKKQSEAIHMILNNRISIVTGNAGTGKKTVLRVIFHVLGQCDFTYLACAASEPATKRLREATDRHGKSCSVAEFIHNASKLNGQEPRYVVIDEAEIVDTWSLWKILNTFGKSTRLVLVGDPAQLAPVGAGLTLHLLADASKIPQVTLEQIVRQDDECEISRFTHAVRNGDWLWNKNRKFNGIDVVECDKFDIADTVIALYGEDPENTQILSSSYESRYGGINPINRLCQSAVNPNGGNVASFNAEYSSNQFHGLRVGDPVIMTANDWRCDLANGSLGKVIKAYDEPLPFTAENGLEELSLGLVKWSNRNVRPIYLSDLDPDKKLIQLAYCLSVHNAQGSKFERVIIPVPDTRSLITDRCWLYTAMTRAKDFVILVGKSDHIAKVVAETPISHSRVSALKPMLDYI